MIEKINWIPRAERLPDDDSLVLLHTPIRTEPTDVGYLDGEQWRSIEGMPIPAEEIEHWAAMPVGQAS